eukprot:scaffold89064_cov66-Phaeocystis_antarctica.AAC.3
MGCGASKPSKYEATGSAEAPTSKPSAAKAAPAPAVAPINAATPASSAGTPAGNMDTFKSMLGAWGKGEFATLDNPAWAAHLAKDIKFDATAAAGLHPVFKMYEGYAGFKEVREFTRMRSRRSPLPHAPNTPPHLTLLHPSRSGSTCSPGWTSWIWTSSSWTGPRRRRGRSCKRSA